MGRGHGRTASILSQMLVPNPRVTMASKPLGRAARGTGGETSLSEPRDSDHSLTRSWQPLSGSQIEGRSSGVEAVTSSILNMVLNTRESIIWDRYSGPHWPKSEGMGFPKFKSIFWASLHGPLAGMMDYCGQVRDAHSVVGDRPCLLGQAPLASKHPSACPCPLMLVSRWLMVLGHGPSLPGEDFAPAVLSTKKGRSISVLEKRSGLSRARSP